MSPGEGRRRWKRVSEEPQPDRWGVTERPPLDPGGLPGGRGGQHAGGSQAQKETGVLGGRAQLVTAQVLWLGTLSHDRYATFILLSHGRVIQLDLSYPVQFALSPAQAERAATPS